MSTLTLDDERKKAADVPVTTTATTGDGEDVTAATNECPSEGKEAKSDGQTAVQEESSVAAAVDGPAADEPFTWAKIGYVALYGGLGFLYPFWSLLLSGKGFSPVHVGFITAVQPLTQLVMLPSMTLYADRHRCGLKMLSISATLSALFALIMCYAEDLTVVAGATIALFISLTPFCALYDDHTMSMLPPDRQTEWGNLRVFGAYGWAVSAPASSYLFGNYGWTYSSFGFGIGTLLTAYSMYASQDKLLNRDQKSEKNYKAVVQMISAHKGLSAFVLGACFMGMGYVFIGTFLFIFLKNELQAPDLLLGISVTVTLVIEIPFMAKSAWLHDRFTDAQLFTAAACGWVFRVVGYSLLTNPWQVLVLEPLHGFTFALLWLSCVHYFSQTFPKDLSATAFGVLHGSVFGFGPFFGNIIAGYMYDELGPRVMYRVMALVMACMLVGFWHLYRGHVALMESRKAQEEAAAMEDGRVGGGEKDKGGEEVMRDTSPKEVPRHGDVEHELPHQHHTGVANDSVVSEAEAEAIESVEKWRHATVE